MPDDSHVQLQQLPLLLCDMHQSFFLFLSIDQCCFERLQLVCFARQFLIFFVLQKRRRSFNVETTERRDDDEATTLDLVMMLLLLLLARGGRLRHAGVDGGDDD